ncbi:HPP family protein [Rhodoferax ferrireducens]|uniref:CBS domain-containing protein n=1 Tax=Rhodoferax ferrireducens TaxID=192843 RepID=UPI000E0D87AD|nr:CBS domain-containing protein [Rhodoferax ferrireducens]
MFSVYGVGGQLFRGSLEKLRQIGGVSAVARNIAIQAVGRDGRDGQSTSAGAFAGPAPQIPGDETHRSALAAYAQSQKVMLERQPLTRVDALMSRSVVTLPDTSTVLEAWQILARHGVGQAPVVNGAAMLVGLLSRADLLRSDRLPKPDSSALVWRALLAQSVSDVMSTPVPSVAPDTDIRRVARVLLDTGLPGLPVVDEQGLVIGFVSRSDILRAVVTDPPLDLWG